MKQVSLKDFLDESEIKKIISISKKHDINSSSFITTVHDEVIKPNIAKINKKLGQENDPKFLSYAIQYIFMTAAQKQNLKLKKEYTDKYENVIFLEGEGEKHAHKFFEIIDERGKKAAFEFLLQWFYPGEHQILDNPGYGTDDEIYEKDDFIMFWNEPLHYAGLVHKLVKKNNPIEKKEYLITHSGRYYNPKPEMKGLSVWVDDLSNAVLFTYSDAVKIQADFYRKLKIDVSIEKYEIKQNPVGPGYHDVSIKYNLGGHDYDQIFYNIKAQSGGIANEKAIKTLENIIGSRVVLKGIGAKSGKYEKPNPKKPVWAIQSVKFTKKWSLAGAKSWLKDHINNETGKPFLSSHMDKSKTEFAFRQLSPDLFKGGKGNYGRKKFGNSGISILMGVLK